MSESNLIQVDIGSSADVSGVNDMTGALGGLNSAAQQAAGGASSAGQAASGAAGGFSTAGGAASGAGGAFSGAGGALSAFGGAMRGLGPEAAPLGSALSSAGGGARLLGAASEEGGVGIAGMAGAASAGIGIVAALGIGAGNNANQVMRLSAVMGIGEEQTRTWSLAMQYSGGSANQLLTATRMLETNMTSTGAAGQRAATDFNTLGVSTKNADGSAKTAGQTFTEVIPALAGMADGAQRDAIAHDLFGRSYENLIPLVDHFSEIMPKAAAEATKASVALNPEAAIKYNMAMANLGVEVTNIGAAALPVLVTGLNVVSGGISTVSSVAGAVVAPFQAVDQATGGVGSKLFAIGSAAAVAGGMLGPVGAIAVGGAVAFEEFHPQIDKVINSLTGSASASDSAGSALGDLVGQDQSAAQASATLSKALGDQVNALNLSKYGFEASAAGAEAGAQSLEAYTQMLGSATQAQIAFAEAQGQSVNYSSSGSYSYSAVPNSSVPGRATGGPVEAGKAYLVGEAGVPELFVSKSDGYIFPNAQGGGSMSQANIGGGGGGNIAIIVNHYGDTYGMNDFTNKVLVAVRSDAQVMSVLRGYLN